MTIEHLGSGAKYDTYNQVRPDLLNPIERKFYTTFIVFGYDVWNCYEVSALRNDGRPVVGILRFCYDASSTHIIESKSVKLYLNSYNNVRVGRTNKEVAEYIEQHVSNDLGNSLSTVVHVRFFDLNEEHADISPFKSFAYNSPDHYMVKSNLLRSNCKVTNQPDWADVGMLTSKKVDKKAFEDYIVSMRNEQHFHEEICELIYNHFDIGQEDILVACLYTRRGGIDINPVRARSTYLLTRYMNLDNLNFLQKKSYRQ